MDLPVSSSCHIQNAHTVHPKSQVGRSKQICGLSRRHRPYYDSLSLLSLILFLGPDKKLHSGN